MNERLLYVLPSMALAAVAIILALWGLGIQQTPPASVSPAPSHAPEAVDKSEFQYLVALEPLQPGETLNEKKFRRLSSEQALIGAVPAAEISFGETIKSAVAQGQLLTEKHLSTSRILETLVPDEHQAMAIPVDDVVGVGGLLNPGDRVNVMAYFRRSDKKDEPAALSLLQDVLVLAVKGVSMAEQRDEDANGRNRNSTVVLAVPDEKVAGLLLASSEGALRLAAISPAESEKNTAGSLPSETSNKQKIETVYLDNLFPSPPKKARKVTAPPSVTRVQVFEGTDSRNVYVR